MQFYEPYILNNIDLFIFKPKVPIYYLRFCCCN